MTPATARPKARRSTSVKVDAAAPAAKRPTTTRAPRRRRVARKGPLVQLTAEGVRGLQEHVARLRAELDGMRELLGDPRRDERLVLDAERLFAEIDSYEGLIAQSDPLDEVAARASSTIVLGSRVAITFADGGREIVRLVHPSEAFLDEERISAQSPLAQALLGLSAGDTAQVKAPAGTIRVTIDAVGADVDDRVAVGAA
jgi:transcription elongation GreA/GreB family factor